MQPTVLIELRRAFRSRVTEILGYCDALADVDRDGELGLADDLGRVIDACHALLALARDRLQPAALETGVDLTSDEVLRSLRHDLKTPLNHIIGYTELIEEDLPEDVAPSCAATIAHILRSAGSINALIDEISSAGTSRQTAVINRGAVRQIDRVLREIPSDRGGASHLKGHILVVDDNEGNREMLARRLSNLGHAVTTAEDGQQALDRLRDGQYDLLLLDIIMPVMTGIDVLKVLKADPELRSLPVIVISGLDETSGIVHCIELGAEEYLSKPFNPVLLQARVGACLEKKRLRDREQVYLQQIEQERNRADDLLHLILPHDIVLELLDTGLVKPKRHEDVAVLFADIVGFTPYCQNRDPKEIVESLSALIERFEQSAVHFEMEKIKTIGDAFMAAAGLIHPTDNPVLQAAKCGLQMLEAVHALSVGWDLRIGIHVGPVVAGVMGNLKQQYDLWGDTVNTASRMESHGVAGAITLSADAWRRLSTVATGRSLGPVPVKGHGQMEIFVLEALRAE